MIASARSAAIAATLAATVGGSVATGQPMPPQPVPPAARQPPRLEPVTNVPAGVQKLSTALSTVMVTSNEARPGLPSLRNVRFREEATDLAYFSQNGGGSVAGSAQVNCDTGEFQLESFSLFSRNNLAGETVSHFDRRSAWQTPRRTTVMGRVIELSCRGRPVVVAQAKTAALAPPPVPAPRPQAIPAPSPAPRTARPTPPSPQGAFQGAVQITAARSEPLAREALDALAKAEPDLLRGRPNRVVRVEIEGRPMFRALVGGFDSRDAALALCSALTKRNHDCLIRN